LRGTTGYTATYLVDKMKEKATKGVGG